MKRSMMWMAVAAVAVASGAGVLVGRALATGAPTVTPLTYAGTVTDKDGKPYPTAVDVQVAFYDSLNATTAKCTAPLAQAEAGTGRFQVVLPVECVQAVHDVADLWSEAVVGPGKQVLPRTHVGAVPYALEADVASKAGGALKAEIEALKTGGGGGSGPWVVDAKGVKLGRLLDVNTDLPPAETFAVLTSGGYIVHVRPDGTYRSSSVMFSGLGCTGATFVSLGNGYMVSNRRAFFSKLKAHFFVPDGPANGISIGVYGDKVGFSPNSVDGTDGVCGSYKSNVPGLLVSPILSADMGLPATLTPPLTIAL